MLAMPLALLYIVSDTQTVNLATLTVAATVWTISGNYWIAAIISCIV